MTSIAEKYAAQWLPNGEVSLADLIQSAIDEATDEWRKAADRYLWLRTGDNDEQCIHFTNDCPAGTDTVWIHRNEKLDAIIDAAIAQEGVK